jgi:polyvinyl alcohol dehydrogenase (cytochrome)
MLRGASTIVAFGSVAVELLSSSAAAASLNSYPAYLGGPAHDSYASSATTITIANATALQAVWKWTPPGGDLTASPIVNGGIVYIGTENGDFYAINAATGAMKWHKVLSISNCANSGIVSSATVAKDPESGKLTVYVGAGDHYLYALNASSGATIWRHLIGPATSNNDYYNFSSPTIANGHIYYGVATACGAGYDGMVALDQHTGAQTGVYYTSGSAAVEGASVYTSAAVAPDGSVFLTTGDDNGASTNDSTAIVKLAGVTLARLAGYQIPGLVGKNMDFNASATLFSDAGTPAVGACDKNGVFYARKQSDMSALWQDTLGIPPPVDSLAFCGGSAVYNGADLFIGADATASGAPPGSIYELTASGAKVWETPLAAGPVIGTPSLDGGGVLAVPTYNKTAGAHSAVYVLNASTGAILRTISYSGPIFAQPVFADGELLIAGPTLQAYVP